MVAESNQLEKAVRLIEGGKREEALTVVKNVLGENEDKAAAWKLLAEITDIPQEREQAIYHIRRLGAEPVSDTAGSLDGATVEVRIRQAYDQVQAGNRRIAMNIISPVLLNYPGHPGAWFVKGLASKEISGYYDALKRLKALASSDPKARTYYERLSEHEFNGAPRKKVAPVWFAAGGVALLLILIGGALVLPLVMPSSEVSKIFPSEDLPLLTCEEVIANAFRISDQHCNLIGTNQVCYGNDRLTSEIIGNPDEFDLVGDVLEIDKLLSLQASPLNLAENLWGVAVFKVQANLEGTVPGQNVTFVVFGNTDITNTSGDMSAFYFSTGFGGIKCQGVDFNGLQVITPDGAGITFTANGVELSVEGHAIMTADAGEEMKVTVVTGRAKVSANGVTQSMAPGTSVSVPIDENLEASGMPSPPQVLNLEEETVLCQLYGTGCPPGESSFILIGPTQSAAQIVPPAITQTDSPGPSAAAITTAPLNSTPVSPTGEPENLCDSIAVDITGYGEFLIENHSSRPVRLDRMGMTWPSVNGDWVKIEYGLDAAETPDLAPGSTYTFEGAEDQRLIEAGGSLNLKVQFAVVNSTGEYSASFYFDVGCSTFVSGN